METNKINTGVNSTMNTNDIKGIEAITGAKVIAAAKENSVFNSDFVLLNDNGVIRQAFTVRDINGKLNVDVWPGEYDSPAAEFSELSHAATIARRIETMKPRGAWKNGVKQYALMLLDWYETEANESPLTLETMLNGAKDWEQYARGGAGVAQCYNARIAETLCSPSELKRNNHGAKMPNRFEDWQDIEARALFQAWRLITEAETLVNCNA